MSDGGVDIHGLDRIAAHQVDTVEVLRQHGQFTKAVQIAHAMAPVQIHDVGW